MLAVGIPSSRLPRPKPLTMGPERGMGKGAVGPVEGPARGERGREVGIWGSGGGGGGVRGMDKGLQGDLGE